MADYDHSTGAGHVPRHYGDYHDAITNHKSIVNLYVHEALGGMSPSTAKRLHYLARIAKKDGCDGTDYGRSTTANHFTAYYGQRLSWAAAGGTGEGIIASLNGARRGSLGRRTRGAH